jgi:ubiquinone/menaquinone biosynthesis C-methylase UbiE
MVDLGCGFGKSISNLNGTIPNGSECIGIDKLENNKKYFLKEVSAAGFEGKFLIGSAERIAEVKNQSCQLIIANYSLYFFPDILHAIRKALKDNGYFIVITHSKNQIQEFFADFEHIIQSAGMDIPKPIFKKQLQNQFNSENGEEILARYFTRIKRTDYKNDLRFPYQHLSKCAYYLNFKRHTIFDESIINKLSNNKILKKTIINYIRKKSEIAGLYNLNKDDTIFHCRP